MMKKFSTLALLVLLAASCTQLDQFSDANKVTSFKVTAHSPEEIIIDNAKIEGDTIFIPILYGKYNFPLKIRAAVTTSPDINKIVGIDFTRELLLENIDSELKFYVVAQSGSTRTYYIRTREIPLDENNYIYGNVTYRAVSPAGAILSMMTHRDADNEFLQLFGVELDYPVALKPEFEILSSSRFGRVWLEGDEQNARDYINGETELTFQDASTIYCLSVLSQSGLARVWKISLQSCMLLDEQSSGSTDLYVNPKTLSITGNPGDLTVIETQVDDPSGSISITIEKSTGQPLSLNFQMPVNDLVDLIGIKADDLLTFDSFDDVKVFYILDSYHKTAKKWTVYLSEFKSSLAQVLSFGYEYEARLIKATPNGAANTPSIVMDPSKVIINPKEREISLFYTSYQNDNNTESPNWWGFTLKNPTITLSDGATCNMPVISWLANDKNQAASLLAEPRTFVVTAEDKTESIWSIKLLSDGFTLSSECEIKSITIDKVIPNHTSFEDNPIRVDNANLSILIYLKDDEGSYPMQIFPNYSLPAYASVVSQDNEARPLTFADSQSVETVTVQAQDGTSRNYTVQLVSPVKSENADILNINFEAPKPDGFTFDRAATYDAATRIITLHVVSNDTAFPLTAAYNGISLSDRATASIPDRGNLVFSKSTERIPITVRAQNGSNKIWYVVLDYRPQLYNWNLNSWNGNNPGNPPSTNYWATANTTGIITLTGTTSGVGSSGLSGDQAAVLTTKKAPIVGTLAAGTLFQGKFDSSNILAGLNDPVSLTNFGIPFTPTAKIKGVMIDVAYHPNTVDKDWASATVNLIYWDGAKTYEFHGDKPGSSPTAQGSPHSKNTAVLATSTQLLFGTGKNTTTYGHTVTVLKDNEWQKDVFIPVNGNVTFTHISVVFSSSCYGDYFIGEAGSVFKVDNVRIVYE